MVTDAVSFLDSSAVKETDCLHRTGLPQMLLATHRRTGWQKQETLYSGH